MEKLTYDVVLRDPEIERIYKDIDTQKKHRCWHGWIHVLNTIEAAKRLFEAVDVEDDIQQAVLLALSLHDIGKSYPDGKKVADHNVKGWNFCNNYLNGKEVVYKEEVLDAVLNHCSYEYTGSLICELVRLCDKADITHKRLTEYGKTIPEFYGGIFSEIRFGSDNGNFVVTVLCGDSFVQEFADKVINYPELHAVVHNAAAALGKKVKLQFVK